MVNILKLKARLKEKDLTQETVAKMMKMNPSTFNKKLNDKTGKYFTIREIKLLKEILDIPNSDVNLYFFCS